MKNGLTVLFKLAAILAALSAVIVSIAVFRYEIEEFLESIRDKLISIKCGEKDDFEDEYVDFADV